MWGVFRKVETNQSCTTYGIKKILPTVQRDLFMVCLERVLNVRGKRRGENMVLQCGFGFRRARSNCFTHREDTDMLLYNVS